MPSHMLSSQATVKVDDVDNEWRVLNYSFEMFRTTDMNGQPTSANQGGQIKLVLEMGEDTDFIEWCVDNYKTKGGTITFYKKDQLKASLRRIEWVNGYVVAYKEAYDSIGANPMTLNVTITAQKITINGHEQEFSWTNNPR